jgi:hypothetical protein
LNKVVNFYTFGAKVVLLRDYVLCFRWAVQRVLKVLLRLVHFLAVDFDLAVFRLVLIWLEIGLGTIAKGQFLQHVLVFRRILKFKFVD